jgi:hypothetical protein
VNRGDESNGFALGTYVADAIRAWITPRESGNLLEKPTKQMEIVSGNLAK